MSRMFVGLVMMLVDEGKVSLDDPAVVMHPATGQMDLVIAEEG